MKVYRYLTQYELNCILTNNKNFGGNYKDKKFKFSNSHNYKENKKYIHFFKKKSNIEKIKPYYNDVPKQCYICTFDIPAKILAKYIGIGRYDEWFGYDQIIHTVIEFAIPVDIFKSEWLESYVVDHTKTINDLQL